MRPKFYLILAVSENNGIGYKGGLPWSLRKELSYFGRMTKHVEDASQQNAIIMGKNTWFSIPETKRPMPGRLNMVLSSQELELDNALHCHDWTEVLTKLESNDYKDKIETAWVIGGSHVYQSAVKNNLCDRIYMTHIYKSYPCDTFVSLDLQHFRQVSDPRVDDNMQEEEGVKYQFKVYEKCAPSN